MLLPLLAAAAAAAGVLTSSIPAAERALLWALAAAGAPDCCCENGWPLVECSVCWAFVAAAAELVPTAAANCCSSCPRGSAATWPVALLQAALLMPSVALLLLRLLLWSDECDKFAGMAGV
jgi:hypothetical protein